MQFFKCIFPIARNTFLCTKEKVLIYKKLNFKAEYLAIRYRCDFDKENVTEDDLETNNYDFNELSNKYLGFISGGHRVFIIQPYIKWGKDKRRNTTRELQLSEAEALINTLPHWEVVDKICTPLLTYKRKYLFGSGTFQNLQRKIRSNQNITAVFISMNVLKHVQAKELTKAFGVPVYDRYSIIIHIFREHAKTPEAKLQVELAEIPYIWQKISSLSDQKFDNYSHLEHKKKILEARESKLQKKFEKLKQHRTLIRSNRQKYSIPTIAVVGYTNAGKTSLIKALTGDISLEPKNQLFATLDTTTHQGVLPCTMKVLYIDTIGFIQDVPERLMEPFIVTLEDAMMADIIIHIYDASHPDKEAQIEHVKNTLQYLHIKNCPIINVANKCDIATENCVPQDVLPVSAVNLIGIDLLRYRIQKEILAATNRIVMKMRVRSGSTQEAWLYKEMTVIDTNPDMQDSQYIFLDVITTDEQLYRFKRHLRQQ